MERIQAEMAANDDSLAAIRDRVSGTGARAEAGRELDPPNTGGDDEIVIDADTDTDG